MKTIEPHLEKLSEYFKLDQCKGFLIPEYQRAYSWEIAQCDKLWQDITEYIEEGNKKSYFFGTIILNCHAEGNDREEILDLIDGQQRTTTFMLLLKALLIRVNAAIKTTSHDEDSEALCRALKERRRSIMSMLYKLDTDDIPDKPDINIDRDLFKNVNLLENKSINELYKTEFQTIQTAVDYTDAESKVIKIPRKQKDNKYTNFFKNFRFFYDKAGDLSDSELNKFAKTFTEECVLIVIKSWQVEQAITMFNSLNSDGMPLMDADIVAAKLYAVAEGNGIQEDFSKSWMSLIGIIDELNQNNVLNIDDILYQQMYFERAVRKEHLSATGSVILTTPGLRRYYTEVNKSLLDKPIELCDKITNLANIWSKMSSHPMIQVMLKFNGNAKLFIACYFSRFNSDKIEEKDIEGIVNCMLRLFSVLELVDVGFSSKHFRYFLFGELSKLSDPEVPIEDIKADFDDHILQTWDYDDIKGRLSEYDESVLVFLNELLFAKKNGYTLSLSSKYDIEHIMPSSGKSHDTIREDAGIGSEEEFKGFVNRLGNKILLETDLNRSIGNEWFSTKVSHSIKDKKGYKDSKFPIASYLVSKYATEKKPYWTKTDIEAATESSAKRIADFIFDRKDEESEEN